MQRKHEKLKYLDPAFVMALIFALSHHPQLPHSDIVPYYDKFLHVVAYAVLAAAWVFAFKTGHENRPGRVRIFAAALAIAVLYGVSDEYHQMFVPGRSCEAADVLADALGAATGAWAWVAIKPMKKAA